MAEKSSYYYKQSAVIPFRSDGDELQILMITSRKKKRWIIPKGIIEPHLSAADSAAKEALEEGGIKGNTLPQAIGNYTYEKWGGTCRAEVFVMEVTQLLEQWDEDFRDREWLAIPQAIERIAEKKLKEICATLPGFLQKQGIL
ncbi:MAG: NUDIX hydrolase [Magnetococcales bacterium]|nr:NUDIX hydrolase [Magnetococcales bacterium]